MKSFVPVFSFFIWISGCTNGLFSQEIPTDSTRRLAGLALEKYTDSLQKSAFLRHGTLACQLRKVSDAQVLFDHQGHKTLPPASTMKLVSTATAFCILGENFTYQTTLEYTGEIRDSVLYGHVYIIGNGDPSLGSWRWGKARDRDAILSDFVLKIKGLGIKKIEGGLVGDASSFDENTTPDTWTWGNMGNYFGAGAGGLNYNENAFRVIFQPQKRLEPAPLLRTEPDMSFMKFLNKVSTAAPGTGDQVNVYTSPYQSVVVLEGTVPQGAEFGVRGSVPDPAWLLAQEFRKALLSQGVVVSGEATSTTQLKIQQESFYKPLRNVLHTVVSPPLADLAQKTNFHSINLFAEALWKTAAKAQGHGSDNAAGIKATELFWKNKGLRLPGFRVKDGSGLAAQNAISPDNLTEILAAMSKESSFQAFYASIPALGVAGTVANLGRGTRAAGNVRAKSGTIQAVRAYAGYVTARNGELLAFSVIFNQFDGEAGSATRELEKLMVMLCDF
jgi:serine-type D-Ala-D-Ala carboxypeptidase/endopeptidase (penicillin-binding protein 4)